LLNSKTERITSNRAHREQQLAEFNHPKGEKALQQDVKGGNTTPNPREEQLHMKYE